MKLNQLLLLGAASLVVTALPMVGNSIAAQPMPAQSTVVASSTTEVSHSMFSAPMAQSGMMSNLMAQNPMAQGQPVAIASGTFVAAEKPTTGTARIVTEGGHRYLELDAAFSTSNLGPDLHVLLDSSARPAQTYDNLGSVINLGGLREYSGAQRYPIPDAVNLSDFKSVVIWCRMANATFGYAPLQPTSNARVQ